MEMKEIAQQLPTAIGARIVESHDLMGSYRAMAEFKNWPIMIAFWRTSSGRYSAASARTEMTAAFVSTDNFKFSIGYAKNIAGMFVKKIPIVYPELASGTLAATTNDEAKLGAILQDQTVHSLIVKIFDSSASGMFVGENIQIEPADGNVHVVLYQRVRLGNAFWNEDISLFKNVYELLKAILTQMEKLGSTSDESPDKKKVAGMS
ncbi:MAG: hypothetical protein KGH59_04800 [Candidatus Micrarchaeota archaeon]|nr:hypothetical protein [Candidatus Micrarchaeota archaeon]MDE1805069.1 hypothetical protein [Candidatus Micrarchaeota archaeon]MDE1847275.1 hypothetical protein [Candidatus Micrarchaeota archaeon]